MDLALNNLSHKTLITKQIYTKYITLVWKDLKNKCLPSIIKRRYNLFLLFLLQTTHVISKQNVLNYQLKIFIKIVNQDHFISLKKSFFFSNVNQSFRSKNINLSGYKSHFIYYCYTYHK